MVRNRNSFDEPLSMSLKRLDRVLHLRYDLYQANVFSESRQLAQVSVESKNRTRNNGTEPFWLAIQPRVAKKRQ